MRKLEIAGRDHVALETGQHAITRAARRRRRWSGGVDHAAHVAGQQHKELSALRDCRRSLCRLRGSELSTARQAKEAQRASADLSLRAERIRRR